MDLFEYVALIRVLMVCRSKLAEDALYQLPDHIEAITSKIKKTEDMLSNQMLSGIPEIDLGIE